MTSSHDPIGVIIPTTLSPEVSSFGWGSKCKGSKLNSSSHHLDRLPLLTSSPKPNANAWTLRVHFIMTTRFFASGHLTQQHEPPPVQLWGQLTSEWGKGPCRSPATLAEGCSCAGPSMQSDYGRGCGYISNVWSR